MGKLVVVALILTATLSSCASDAELPAGPEDLYITPYLQNVTPTSITVMWETRKPVVGSVEYGLSRKFDQMSSEEAPTTIHEVHLTGLRPGQTYDYRARYSEVVLDPASFTTAPPPGTKNWRFVVYGDSRTYPDTHAKNVKQILSLKPGFILNTGDLVSQGKVYEQWKEQYFDPLRGLADNVPLFPCLGNHEQNADHYYNYISVPDENGESYYSFDYGNAHIISLNSNSRDAPFQPGEAQTEWLVQDLEAHQDAQWKMVFFHHPLFRCHPTRGITAQRWVWQPIFEKYGVDLVFAGHDHYYQRTYAVGNYTGESRRGVYHVISGGGGANTYPVVPKVHAAARRQVHHITVLDVMDDRMVGRAIDIDGNVFDAFVVDQEAENSAEEYVSYEIYEIERDLGDAILKMPVTAVAQGRARIDTTLSVANPFQVPIRLTFSWRGANQWTVSPQRETVLLKPGDPIRIPLQAVCSSADPLPTPSAVLHFTRPDGEKAFRNDEIVFNPIKVSPHVVASVPDLEGSPVVDGTVDESVWRSAHVIPDFMDVQGTSRAERKVEARLGKAGNMLYVAARIESSEGLTESGYTGRDNRRAPRDDHFRVHLAVGKIVYTYLVTARGTELDAREDDAEWNSTFRSATSSSKGGWQVELAIPLQELAVSGRSLRINLVRRDVAGNTEVELVPTYGTSGLDHRVPMYRSDWGAYERFAELKLQANPHE